MSILLVRHAESAANVDANFYNTTPDHDILLTEKGEQQARDLGVFLKEYYAANPAQGPIRLWASPYRRTTQTMLGMKSTIGEAVWNRCGRGRDIHYDDRLREREWGILRNYKMYHDEDEVIDPRFAEQIEHYRFARASEWGRYYARPYGGESLSDVSLRLQSFFHDLYFDIHNGVKDHIIVMHGAALNVFALAMTKTHPHFHEFEKVCGNTSVRVLDMDPASKRYMDYGYVYDPEAGIRLMTRAAEPLRRDFVFGENPAKENAAGEGEKAA